MTIDPRAASTVIAALVAGGVAFLGLLISKESKTSELRQNWIDGVRSDIADLIAHANSIHGSLIASAGKSHPENWTATSDHYTGINRAAAMIRLRLNPKENQAQVILDKIEEIEKAFARSPEIPDHRTLNRLEKELVTAAQAHLKAEWVRVRQGEILFRSTKWISGSMLVFAALIGAVILAGILF